jgi:hypothetical protein
MIARLAVFRRGGSMDCATVAIDKRRRIEHLWGKLRGAKTDTPEYNAIVNEISVLAMEYHALIDLERKSAHADSLYPQKIT